MKRTLLLLTACGSATGSSDAPPPAAYILDEGEVPVPSATPADIAAALQEGLDTTLTVNALPVEAAYDSAMAGSTGDCPYVYTTSEGSYWFDNCTSPDGTDFDGYVFAVSGTGVYDPYSGITLDYWQAFGGATVKDPQGHLLEIAGAAVWYRGTSEFYGTPVFFTSTQIAGTFAWDGPEAAGTWMEEDYDTDFVSQVQAVPSIGAATVVVVGGFGGFRGGWSIAYDENVLVSEAIGGKCEEEVSGTVGVRAPDGTWYDVKFQGWNGVDEVYDASGCDGCGDLFYEGESMGSICVDVDTMLDVAVSL